LEIFWESHNPTSQSWSQQYRNVLFYHTEEQQKIAEESRDRLASETKSTIVTELLPFTGFYLAEDYHQKHRLRNYPALMEEFEAKYPLIKDLISSTAVTKVNGYLGGNGTCDLLKSKIHELGLTENGNRKLLNEVCGGSIGMSCPTKKCS
jgi:peptide-methionine (S)-S-oxide reductase